MINKQPSHHYLEHLQHLIGEAREKMIQIGLEKGLHDKETIEHSMKLDSMLNIYQKELNKLKD